MLFTLLACSLSPQGAPEAGHLAAGNPWMDEVSARIQDDAHAIVADGETFVSNLSELGAAARFDAEGAWLNQADGATLVRSVGWGRGDAMDAVAAAPPAFGACVPGKEDPEGACVRRLEYAAAGLTEWWTGREDGFEQGWTVAAPPPGVGPLAIDVGVEGATATVGDGEVWLDGDTGAQWSVAGLGAWDADGQALDARFDVTSDGFRVTVDDADARYPITIDPVYTTASSILTGVSANDYFGCSVAGAGDVDGDGYDDVIVGAYYYDGGRGRAYVFPGGPTGVSTTASATLTGEDVQDYFGGAVSGAGDVDGDGYDDVIVGAAGHGSFTGRAYVYLGSASGTSAVASTTIDGDYESDYFSHAVSGAGDVNGDGYDDVIVGAPYFDNSSGVANVYMGSASGTSATRDVRLTGPFIQSYFGSALSGAGDVNADGFDDVIIGTGGYIGGQAFVYSGSASGLDSSATTTLTEGGTTASYGRSVSWAGDVNGDGYDDVIVGAGTYTNGIGQAFVYHGSSIGVATAVSTTLIGDDGEIGFGQSVSGAGDVDGDGYFDVIVGAFDYASYTGRAYVFTGGSSGIPTTADSILTGEYSYDYFGSSVSDAGDVNGDGYADVIVGGSGYSAGTGRAYVYHGYVDVDGDGFAASEDCDDTDAAINPDATDITGSGVDEDCDGVELCYVDADDDGYRPDATSAVVSTDGECDESGEALADAPIDDCDDTNPSAYPGAPEVTGSGVDEDCDGAELCYTDADDDGYRPDATSTVESADGDCDDAGEALSSALTEDCDDADGAYNPGAVEADCTDPNDYNCDGSTGYTNVDGDAYAACEECNDGDATVYPGSTEVPGDGVDSNCDGVEDCFVDADDDGYRPDATSTVSSANIACDGAGEALGSDPTDDCDDAAAAVNPDADELCNGVDDDCDGTIDVDAIDALSWYADADGDGYSNPGEVVLGCDPPAGYGAASDLDDCDDADASSFPGAEDLPDDGVDQDCDGADAVAISEGYYAGGLAGCNTGGGAFGGLAALLALSLAAGRRVKQEDAR